MFDGTTSKRSPNSGKAALNCEENMRLIVSIGHKRNGGEIGQNQCHLGELQKDDQTEKDGDISGVGCEKEESHSFISTHAVDEKIGAVKNFRGMTGEPQLSYFVHLNIASISPSQTGENLNFIFHFAEFIFQHLHFICLMYNPSISTLATLIQVKFQSESFSPFETQFGIMAAFVVALIIYVLAWGTAKTTNAYIERISLWFGALAAILLLCIIFPFVGWFCFLFWAFYSVKTCYDVVKDISLQVTKVQEEYSMTKKIKKEKTGENGIVMI
ncbi:hypothetical protein G4B88_020377 [Cannabis sativa]|uniref:Uncharacterized protein n=1 Tax=Cannabis sativa TaxID=3483 RepID=A0A7J6ENH9_CANSA|nr:hypothetical protein G4B88_020377 [Cannabis sativa]